jgi:hypothetical protein
MTPTTDGPDEEHENSIYYIYIIYNIYRKTLDALAAFHHPEGFFVVCLKNRVPLNPLVNHHIPY